MNAFKNLRELIGPFISYQNTDESPEPAPLTPLLLEECECIFGLSSETTTDGSLQCILDRLLSLKPYTQWFTVSSLDLRSQKLTSVCDLAAILPSLETLDLSDNLIQHVTNLPMSLRSLKINRNRLTDINGLVKLENLRYLDICNNSVRSFKGIEALALLKVIHAENNMVSNCSPFSIMHGLMQLNLRSNRLKKFDFGYLNLRSPCLVNLDVSYNRIVCLDALEGLTQLKVLHLEHNELTCIDLKLPLMNLKLLCLDFNRLSTFDGGLFPDLRSLSMDGNHISSSLFLTSCSKLKELSIRDQCGHSMEQLLDLHSVKEARTLQLSGNIMKSMPPMPGLFALDYLEMCGVQLDQLPHDFAQQAPYLTVLCLCHNHLECIKPLRKLYRLRKLVLLNNRLENVNDLVKNLHRLGALRYLDLRDNPMTYKYYPTTIPSSESRKRQPCQCIAQVPDDCWTKTDIEYTQALSLVWLQRRSTYRAVIIKSSPALTVLDGIFLSSDDNAQADHIIQLQQLSSRTSIDK